METPFLRAYAQLLIQTCHRRGVHAMGGMAAQIPIKDDPAANDAALAKVRADKLREVRDGHDGTWVAHPALVAIAQAGLRRGHAGAESARSAARGRRRRRRRAARRAGAGTRTEAGLRHNIRVGIQYLEAWLRGLGCVPIYNLMEDAATAEISRTQIWQWIHHRATLDDGRDGDARAGRAAHRRRARAHPHEVGAADSTRPFDDARACSSTSRRPTSSRSF